MKRNEDPHITGALLDRTRTRDRKPHMQRNVTGPGWSDYLRLATPSQGMGAALIALSLLRWPVTAMLASSAWKLPVSQWILISVVQACAEAMFWIGVWLVGRKPLRAALMRLAETWPVLATLDRTRRLPRSVKSRSAVPDD